MAAPAARESLPETIEFSPKQERKSRLKAIAKWHHLPKLSSEKTARFRLNMAFTNWRHTIEVTFYWYLCCIWSALLIYMHIFIPFLLPPRFNSSDEHCAPDGSFRLESFSVVDPAWFFQVVIGFGPLDFTVAKTIDIVWDVVVGRAGQTFLAYISWKTFSKYLCSTTDTLTYRTFWTVFIQDGPTLRSTFRTFSDFTRARGLRSKTAMSFIILTMAFILAFPTLASSMTGYSASNQPWVKTDDINQVPFNEFTKATDLYVIHDAFRINASVNYVYFEDQYTVCQRNNCIAEYTSKYGVSQPRKSIWNGVDLNPPTLDISCNTFAFIYGDKAYEPRYFNDGAVCQPVVEQNQQQQQKYQWGFSFIQLEIVLCLLTLWTVGIYIIWSTAHLRSIKTGTTYNDPGNFKSAISLADTMRKEFKKKTNKDITSFTERELMSSIKTQLNGGQVTVQSPSLIPERIALKLIQEWIKANESRIVVISLLFSSLLTFAVERIVREATTM